MSNFVHLHVHTEYSLLDGAARISNLAKRAKELGMPAVAMTDHGNMYGAVAFYHACTDNDVKPILGTEFYVCDDLTVKTGKTKLNHLVLLVKNETGYKNISLLNAIASRDGFYYKPRIDFKTLKEHHEGLICLSACVAGEIPQAILNREFDEAEKLILDYKELFGEDFYLEIQNHGLPEEYAVMIKLKEYAVKFGIELVATNDVHYINKEDALAQDILLCVQMKKDYDDPNRMKFANDEFYFKTEEEMLSLFEDVPNALTTTLKIAEKCNFDFVFGKYMFPHYYPENGDEPIVYIRKLIDEGIKKKYKQETKEIRDRIESELEVIEKQGFIEYYLIVWDYINAARNMGISVGPGRGSGAGSVVAYLIGITDIDPIKYDLYFERFLNSERVSAPDFDVDFEDSRREEVIDYVKRKYGDERVCRIVTFGTMAAKNAIKDVGRALKVPYSETDKITKLIPNKKGDIEIKKPYILQKVFGLYKPSEKDKDYGVDYSIPELVAMYESSPEIKKLVDLAIQVEDMPRQASTHACGVVIGADVLDRHMPLARNDEDITSQYTGVELESLGFLKMDFLGLRNLTDIKLCQQYVKENHGVDVDFSNGNYDDQKVYELMSSGNTKAIFQIESVGFQNFLKDLKPNCLEDIIAAVSLYRPGPMDSIPTFVKNKHNPELVKYDHPLLEPILKQTYGCIVYQEQVMKIVQVLAGYTLGQADNVRRMMGKKKVEAMAKEEIVFLNGREEGVDDHGKKQKAIDGCVKRGVDEQVAKNVWDKMKDFAKYAFNKSHAAAYSIVTYQTAYLKCYYKPEFLTAVLNNRITNIEEIKNYVSYAKKEGIEVLQPDINESKGLFTVRDGKIRFGLGAVKGVGLIAVDSIVQEREKNGNYKSFEDFALRCESRVLNKRLVENLIYAGAFDSFGKTRSQLIRVYEEVLEKVAVIVKQRESNQLSFFGLINGGNESIDVDYPNVKEYDSKIRLSKEKEVVGVYVTGHPLDQYMHYFNGLSFSTDMLSNIETDEDGNVTYLDVEDGQYVSMGGIISSIRKIDTKSGKQMCSIEVEDIYGSVECIMFPKVFERLRDEVIEEGVIKVFGKLQLRDGENANVIVDRIEKVIEETEQDKENEHEEYLGIILTDENKQYLDEVLDILSQFEGEVNVIIKVGDQKMRCSQKVRKCNGLTAELKSIVGENDLLYFTK